MSHQPDLQPTSDIAYSVAEVAEKLRTSQSTVRGLIHAGRLRAKRLGRRQGIRVPASALASFLAESDFISDEQKDS